MKNDDEITYNEKEPTYTYNKVMCLDDDADKPLYCNVWAIDGAVNFLINGGRSGANSLTIKAAKNLAKMLNEAINSQKYVFTEKNS